MRTDRKFNHGDRVQLNTYAIRMRIGSSLRIGTVLSGKRGGKIQPDLSRVLWDGVKTPETYHDDFLQLVSKGKP